MRQTIRNNTFETNSSSTHSITIVTQEEFDKFKSGDTYIDWNDEFFTKEEILNSKEYEEFENKGKCSEDKFEAYIEYNDFRNYDNYNREYETFEEHYTTKSGDKIVAFGYYGQDY